MKDNLIADFHPVFFTVLCNRKYLAIHPCFGENKKLMKNTNPVANAIEPEIEVSTQAAI